MALKYLSTGRTGQRSQKINGRQNGDLTSVDTVRQRFAVECPTLRHNDMFISDRSEITRKESEINCQ